jgi:3-isopropylmalate/(R)-2-methylmalate dehydratase small subunit
MVGRVWKYGDDIDTDVIIPARYLSASTAEELGRHCMEGVSPEFASEVRPGDIIVAGENFGCGSSREHAPLAIKGCGVSCVIAKSYARIFYRNAINTGLPILECREAVESMEQGDEVQVDLEGGSVSNLRTRSTYRTSPFPPFILSIIRAGGLVPYTAQRLGEAVSREPDAGRPVRPQ